MQLANGILTASLLGLLSTAVVTGDEFTFGEQTFVVPDGFTVERAVAPALAERPITMDFDESGHLYVSESSGSNDKVKQQLEEKPHRILRLKDEDGDGVFDSRTVFADRMMLPEGTLWFRGSLYVSAPPEIWKLTDTDDDGIADRREVWFDGKTLTGCANDLHGPYRGRDGWIYWCKGAFAEQTYNLPGRGEWKTRASHIFRARPDGTGIEPVLTGGMDNPVDVVFTPDGERILSCTFLQHPSGGRRDGLIHAIYGGVYGKNHGVLDGHPRTGDLMPPMTHLSAAAPCGLHYLESGALGPDYTGSVFAAHFNLRKVTRHVLSFRGAALVSKDSDFFVSDSADFHPTDIIEDADGSLLVCDTGGWYKLCCPTSQIAKPDVPGAIYRIRHPGAKRLDDPRGMKILWEKSSAKELASFLDDPRPAVRERAIESLAATGPDAVQQLKLTLEESHSRTARLNALWALSRIPGADARRAARSALADADDAIRRAGCHVAGLWRDAGAFDSLRQLLLDGAPSDRRATAEAVGRLGLPQAAADIFEACQGDIDRVLFHSLTYAALETKNGQAAREALSKREETAIASALYVLEQLPGENLTARDIAPHITSANDRLREAALWVASRHAGWADTLGPVLLAQVKADSLKSPENFAELFAASKGARDALAELAAEGNQSALSILSATAAKPSMPSEWVDALVSSLPFGGETPIGALAMIPDKHPKRADIDSALVAYAEKKITDPGIRLSALAAVKHLPDTVPDGVFQFVSRSLGKNVPSLHRGAAARILARSKLTQSQLQALADSASELGALELNTLLPAFASASAEARNSLFSALETSPSLAAIRPDILASLPDESGKITRLIAQIDSDRSARAERLDTLAEALSGGDARRGHEVFHSAEAGCAACHALGYAGGRLGPDLSRIGSIRTERDLLEAIIFPSASFVRSYETVVVRQSGGAAMSGIIQSENAAGVTLSIAPGAEVQIPRHEILTIEPGPASLMPAGYDQILNREQIADLVRFLKERN